MTNQELIAAARNAMRDLIPDGSTATEAEQLAYNCLRLFCQRLDTLFDYKITFFQRGIKTTALVSATCISAAIEAFYKQHGWYDILAIERDEHDGTLTDLDGNVLRDGDKVRVMGKYGVLCKNPNINVSKWYISYEDGEECAVLEEALVFKAYNQPKK